MCFLCQANGAWAGADWSASADTGSFVVEDFGSAAEVGPSPEILALTGNQFFNRWNIEAPLGSSVIMTYSFNASKPAYDAASRSGYVPYTQQQQANVKQALDTWAAAGGIAFVQVPDSVGGQIRFNMVDLSGQVNAVGNPLSGFAFYPGYSTTTSNGVSQKIQAFNNVGGDVFMNANFFGGNDASLLPGQRGYSILLHEIGHAIGFKHPFEGSPTINPAFDNGTYTVMSYTRTNSTTTLGSVDGDALRYYYGAGVGAWSFDPVGLVLTRTGDSGNNVLVGTELTDRLSGGGGRDTLVGSRGSDVLDGGAGTDWVILSNWSFSASITRLADGSMTVRDNATGDIDTLTNVERLQFHDRIVAFDFNGLAGADTLAGVAYRIYQAAFDRTPDIGGLSFWTKWLDDGKTDPFNMAGRFIDSNEFRALYGSSTPANGDFLTKVYQNVLDRLPDQGGYDFWVSRLNNNTFSQAEVLARFSDSDENRANVAPSIANGIVLSNDYFLF
jgi:hypothetical protein